MTRLSKAQDLIVLLEKITGKKVIVEYPETAEAPALSNRQIGAQKAIQTKGLDDWTVEQYAVAYMIARYGKGKLPQPYNSMTMDQIAADSNVKPQSLAMCVSRCKFMLGQEGLKTGGPKIESYFSKFVEMGPEQIASLALNGLTDDAKPGKNVNGHKFADTAVKKPMIARNDISPEELKKINAKRVLNGQKPFILRGGKLFSESVGVGKFALIEANIHKIYFDPKDIVLVEAVAKRAGDNEAREKRICEAVAKKIKDPNKLLSKYKAAMKLGKKGMAEVFYNEAKETIYCDLTAKYTAMLEDITKNKVTFEEGLKPINEAQLNEWFAKGAYSKLLKMLDKAIKQANTLNSLAVLYPEEWNGNETEKIKYALKHVFTTLTSGGKHLKSGQAPKMVEAASKKRNGIANGKEELNEGFAKGAYSKLLRTIDRCEKQAERLNGYLATYPGKFDVDTKLILGKIKKIWQLFNIGKQSGDNVTYAADEVNKLSHKAPRQKAIAGANGPQRNVHDAEADRFADNPAVADIHKNLSKQMQNKNAQALTEPVQPEGQKKSFGSKVVDKTKQIGNKIVDKAKEFANTDATENPNSKAAFPKLRKFATEAKEIIVNDKELNEIFGFSKAEKEKSAFKKKVEQAGLEANNFKLTTLLSQPGGSTPEEKAENCKAVIKSRLYDTKNNMPTLAELVPKLFEMGKGSCAQSIKYKGYTDCIIPSNFGFATRNGELDKERFMEKINTLLDELTRR